MTRSAWIALLFALVVGPVEARAAAAACDAVRTAMLRLPDEPITGQSTVIHPNGKPTMTMEVVMTPDAMFAKTTGAWSRQPLTADMRRDLVKKLLTSMPPTDCTEGDAGDVDGVAAKSYHYRQADPSKGGTMVDVVLWVGADDGRIRKLETEAVTQTLRYEGVSVPKL